MLDIAGQGFFPVVGRKAEQVTSQRLVTGTRQGQPDQTCIILPFVKDNRPLLSNRIAGLDLEKLFACPGIIPGLGIDDAGLPLYDWKFEPLCKVSGFLFCRGVAAILDIHPGFGAWHPGVFGVQILHLPID